MLRRVASQLAVLALLAAAPAARAQAPNYQPIRVDLTVFGGYASADATAYGFGAAIEPKYNLTDQLAVGLRFEGSAFITATIDVDSGAGGNANIEQGARAVSGYLAKAEYYLTTAATRPFVGLGVGLYRIAAGSQSVSTGGSTVSVVQTASAFSGFGFAPQIGVNFGGFRMAGTYHVITGDDMVVVTQAVGAGTLSEVKLSKNFFAFEIGGTFGGKRRVAP